MYKKTVLGSKKFFSKSQTRPTCFIRTDICELDCNGLT